MSQKNTIVSSVSVFFSIFEYSNTRIQQVINNNIDPGGPDPLNLIFANLFKWAPYNNIWMAPYNHIDLGDPGPFTFNFCQPIQMGPLK